MKDIKQVIVVRTHYPDGNGGQMKILPGKAIAQACHASTAWLACRLRRSEGPHQGTHYDCKANEVYYNKFIISEIEYTWLMGLNKKVTLVVSSEEELLDISAKAKEVGILCYVIEDEGLTQFNGVKTKTCLALGPDESSKIDAITGHLRLR